MQYNIDTELGTIRCLVDGANSEHVDVLKFYSIEGFRLLSSLWLKQEWNLLHWQSFSWFGFQIMQLPEDLVRIQEVLGTLRPDVIIETGVKRGGSAIFFASLCRLLGTGRVISIDIDIPTDVRKAIEASPFGDLISLIEGDSISSEVVARVRSKIKQDERVLVFLDSDHSKAHVLHELHAYADLVSADSYIIATDGVMHSLADTPHGHAGWIDDNPSAAAREFVSTRSDFVIERPKAHFRNECQLEELTFWPDAWLKRMLILPAKKMDTCILHYGMHKTGSSAIQESLYDHMPDPAFIYLGMAGANQSWDLVTLFEVDPLDHPMHRRHGTDKVHLMEIQQQIRDAWNRDLGRAAGKTGILSGESMVTLSRQGLATLRDFVSEYAQNLRVVGYIRSPKAYIESAFQERLKDGRLDLQLDLDSLFPRYKTIFTPFEEVFGQERVEYWKYDPGLFPNGDVVKDFCDRISLAYQGDSARRVNERLSLSAVKLLYAYRISDATYGVGNNAVLENRLLVRELSYLEGPKFYLHSSLVAPLLVKYREDIEWMQERSGQTFIEDITEHDHEAIYGAKELQSFTPRESRWLAERLGPSYLGQWREDMRTEVIADWLGSLRRQLSQGSIT